MKLTGKLKEDVKGASDREEAKKIIAKAGMELTDEELDNVSGGLDIIVRLDYRQYHKCKNPACGAVYHGYKEKVPETCGMCHTRAGYLVSNENPGWGYGFDLNYDRCIEL